MGLIITPQEKIDEYFEKNSLSQSTLKKLEKGIDSFLLDQNKEEDTVQKENLGFLIGSAVDCILTGEEGQFDDNYYVSEIDKKPSDVEMNIIKMVFNQALVENDLETLEPDSCLSVNHVKYIKEAIEYFNWQARWKMDTKISKIIEVGEEYFQDLKKAYGKQILSVEQRLLIENIVESLRSNIRTKDYFDRDTFTSVKTVDIYYQLPIFFTYKGLECKALLDMVIVHKDVNTGKPSLIQPIDLKTMQGNTITFLNNLKRFRYDIQAAWYTLALSKYFNFPVENINPFEFVVESTTNVGKPLVFKLNSSLLKIGKSGREAVKLYEITDHPLGDIGGLSINKDIKGYEQLLEEYLYHSETGWVEDKIVAENNGILELTWEGFKK